MVDLVDHRPLSFCLEQIEEVCKAKNRNIVGVDSGLSNKTNQLAQSLAECQ